MVAPVLSREPRPVSSDDEGPLRLVVFGDPGVGKTTLALSFPRPLIINTDFGLEGDALRALKEAGGLELNPTGYRDLEALYFWLRDHADQFDSIIIDSVDELVRVLLDEIVDAGKGKDTKNQAITDFVPEQAEYLANQRQMHRFLSALRGLRKPICLTSAMQDKLGKKNTVDLTPGQQRIIHRWASVMGELLVTTVNDKKVRVLLTDPGSERSVCKSRYAALVPYVIVPEEGAYDLMAVAIENRRSDEGEA